MITKNDVVKKLTFTSANSTSNNAKKQLPDWRSNCNPTLGRSSKRSSQLIDFGRLTSAEFNGLLGEDTDAHTKIESLREKEMKKKEDLIKKCTMRNFNAILASKMNIYDDVVGNSTVQVHHDQEKEKGGVQGIQSDMVEKNVENKENSNDKIVQKPSRGIPSNDNEMTEEKGKKDNTTENSIVVPNKESSASFTDDSRKDPVDSEKSISIQTDDVYISCGCVKCKGTVEGILSVIQQFMNVNCESLVAWQSSLHLSDFSNRQTSISENDKGAEEWVPLVRGCLVKVPVTKKSNLKLAVTNRDPQEYVNELLNIFYTPEELANMTADGRTKGSVKLNPNIADAMQAYIAHKYDDKKFYFTKSLFKTFVNAHTVIMLIKSFGMQVVWGNQVFELLLERKKRKSHMILELLPLVPLTQSLILV